MNYVCNIDGATYTEDEVYDRAWEIVDEEDLIEAMRTWYSPEQIFSYLPEEIKSRIYEEAVAIVKERCFWEAESEEEEE